MCVCVGGGGGGGEKGGARVSDFFTRNLRKNNKNKKLIGRGVGGGRRGLEKVIVLQRIQIYKKNFFLGGGRGRRR